jgi:hypothetical protein
MDMISRFADSATLQNLKHLKAVLCAGIYKRAGLQLAEADPVPYHVAWQIQRRHPACEAAGKMTHTCGIRRLAGATWPHTTRSIAGHASDRAKAPAW